MPDLPNSRFPHTPMQSRDPHAGICASCKFAQVIPSSKGSEFVLCNYSRINPAFPKYPTLPVRQCPGFHDAAL